MPCLLSFFTFSLRPQPRSTLFPYTTLSDLEVLVQHRRHARAPVEDEKGFRQFQVPDLGTSPGIEGHQAERSEEHTSELQSHSDLVCRLLLEKKKRREGVRVGY